MHRLVGVLGVSLLSAGFARAEVEITACGQSVANGDVGVVQTDIVCVASTQTGVILGVGATLQLNGHTLAGGSYGTVCQKRCTIEGPGEISGFANAGVSSSNDRHAKVILRDVVIHDNLNWGVLLPFDARLMMTNVTIQDNNHGGVGLGPTNSLGRVKGTNVMVGGNHGPGVEAKRIVLRDSTIESNDGTGIYSVNGSVRLVGSTVTGNGTDFMPSYDLKTLKPPHLVGGSTCGLSGRLLAGAVLDGTWNVCAGD